MKTALKKILLRLPALMIMCASWYLSSQSKLRMPSGPGSDKAVHFVCFGVLAFAWTFWFSTKTWKERATKAIIITILIVAVYGAVDEFHQSFVPGRECSALDWLADVSGAATACGIRLVLSRCIDFSSLLFHSSTAAALNQVRRTELRE